MTQDSIRPAVPQGKDHQAFPMLTEEQVERARAHGSTVTLSDEASVFERGQREADFCIVVSGCIEIFDYDCDGEPEVFTRHCDRQFTGEIDLFNNRKVLVGGRASGQTEIIRFGRKAFRDLLAAHPDIGEIVTRALIVRRLGILEQNLGGSYLVGKKHDPLMFQIQRFLQGNGYPVRVIRMEDDPMAPRLMERHEVEENDLPLFLCHGEDVLKRPSVIEVAETTGLVEWPQSDTTYDLAVIGGGPGGMAAAVYGASEGLKTVILERQAPGGQASTSSKIENYLGFPNGLSGQELAGRAQIQAQKFGATLALPMSVQKIEGESPPYTIHFDGGSVVTRSIVLATGATYRKLDLSNEARYEGGGIQYAATAMEAGLCNDEEIVVVGGGNSAGQAAVYLSKHTQHVHMLIRGDNLAASMSDYLIQRIDASHQITLHRNTEVVALSGDPTLEKMTWRSRKTGEESDQCIKHLFLMIGAVPNSAFLNGLVMTDSKGFICTGNEVAGAEAWKQERLPQPFETSLPNIFAVGDVRANSVKRVASAVGEGSICIQFVHRVLRQSV
ncbi:MAG: FAD-dependent oxidoreductase [Planctomycetota bacterium]